MFTFYLKDVTQEIMLLTRICGEPKHDTDQRYLALAGKMVFKWWWWWWWWRWSLNDDGDDDGEDDDYAGGDDGGL